MHDLLIAAATLCLSWAGDRLLGWWLRRGDAAELKAAEDSLSRRGLDARLYLPGIGIADPEMHRALDRVASAGRLIIDRDGTVVGGLMPKMVKGPYLRLVVDNTQ